MPPIAVVTHYFTVHAVLKCRFDAPRVVKAFLTHDLPTLRKHCGPELMERLTGIFNHFEAQVCCMMRLLCFLVSHCYIVTVRHLQACSSAAGMASAGVMCPSPQIVKPLGISCRGSQASSTTQVGVALCAASI
jgi:hypothetical protein